MKTTKQVRETQTEQECEAATRHEGFIEKTVDVLSVLDLSSDSAPQNVFERFSHKP